MEPNYELEHRNLKEIVRRLAKTEKWPNNKLPCDYLCLDTETTDTNVTAGNIVQIGLCAVKDCKIVHEFGDQDYMSFTIKLPKEAFAGKEAAIAVHGIDYEKAQRTGLEPTEAYKLLHDILVEALARGMMVCGHNLYSFDIPFFTNEMAKMGITFKFGQNQVVDTAMLVKAMQIGILPGEDETSFSYWSRVYSFRAKGIYFNLDRYCMARFNLGEKYGASKEHAHNAGYDCWLSHLLVAEMNKIVTGE